jgi:hypothetical protein
MNHPFVAAVRKKSFWKDCIIESFTSLTDDSGEYCRLSLAYKKQHVEIRMNENFLIYLVINTQIVGWYKARYLSEALILIDEQLSQMPVAK